MMEIRRSFSLTPCQEKNIAKRFIKSERRTCGERVDFKELAEQVKPCLTNLVQYLLPKGRFERHEYVALNPTRRDRHMGSFRINTQTGRWADFATNDKGKDVIALWAYVKNMGQFEAAKELLAWLKEHGYDA